MGNEWMQARIVRKETTYSQGPDDPSPRGPEEVI